MRWSEACAVGRRSSSSPHADRSHFLAWCQPYPLYDPPSSSTIASTHLARTIALQPDVQNQRGTARITGPCSTEHPRARFGSTERRTQRRDHGVSAIPAQSCVSILGHFLGAVAAADVSHAECIKGLPRRERNASLEGDTRAVTTNPFSSWRFALHIWWVSAGITSKWGFPRVSPHGSATPPVVAWEQAPLCPGPENEPWQFLPWGPWLAIQRCRG